MKNSITLTIILTLFVLTALGCQFQCGSTPDSNSTATNSTNATAKPSEKPAEKPKTETANSNSEASKNEPSKSADSSESPKNKTTVVKFEKGKTSAEFEGSIGNGDTQIYVVNVKKSQYLGAQTYSETDDDVPFIVRKKGGAELEVPEGSVKWGGDVPEDGDYEIVISGIKKNTKYSITISAE